MNSESILYNLSTNVSVVVNKLAEMYLSNPLEKSLCSKYHIPDSQAV